MRAGKEAKMRDFGADAAEEKIYEEKVPTGLE